MKPKPTPTRGAMNAARKLADIELPGAFYGLEGLAEVIDETTQLKTLADATRELLQYAGGWDVTDRAHPIVKAREALRRVTGST